MVASGVRISSSLNELVGNLRATTNPIKGAIKIGARHGGQCATLGKLVKQRFASVYRARLFGHLKINRAIAARYDQLADSFLGMVHIATARYWLKFVHAA